MPDSEISGACWCNHSRPLCADNLHKHHWCSPVISTQASMKDMRPSCSYLWSLAGWSWGHSNKYWRLAVERLATKTTIFLGTTILLPFSWGAIWTNTQFCSLSDYPCKYHSFTVSSCFCWVTPSISNPYGSTVIIKRQSVKDPDFGDLKLFIPNVPMLNFHWEKCGFPW